MNEDRALPLPYSLGLDAATMRRDPATLEQVLLDLYARLRPGALGYVTQVVGSALEAEDVLQLVFLRLFDTLQRGDEIHNVRSWIYRVAHNLAIDQARRAQHRRTLEGAWLQQAETTPRPVPADDALIRQEVIGHALGRLSDRERQCLLLRAEGLKYREIADVLNVSVKAVGVYLARGLEKFANDHDTSPTD
jgi:RNA polymerase sigma-70 factor, ECF subfamily